MARRSGPASAGRVRARGSPKCRASSKKSATKCGGPCHKRGASLSTGPAMACLQDHACRFRDGSGPISNPHWTFDARKVTSDENRRQCHQNHSLRTGRSSRRFVRGARRSSSRSCFATPVSPNARASTDWLRWANALHLQGGADVGLPARRVTPGRGVIPTAPRLRERTERRMASVPRAPGRQVIPGD